MTIERVVAGVDDSAGEPAAIGADSGIEDLCRRRDPVDLARRLCPKFLGVPKRTRIGLVIPALVRSTHDVPRSHFFVMAGLVPAIHGFGYFFWFGVVCWFLVGFVGVVFLLFVVVIVMR